MPAPDPLRPTKTLFGPDRTALPVRGCFTRTITRGQETLPRKIFVVAGARRALLGRTAIEALGVFQRVKAVDAEEIKCKFSKFFKGLGKLDGPGYIIKLKPDAKPHAISTSKSVPAPLLAKMKEDIAQMEQMEIISKVDKPTEWCA